MFNNVSDRIVNNSTSPPVPAGDRNDEIKENVVTDVFSPTTLNGNGLPSLNERAVAIR